MYIYVHVDLSLHNESQSSLILDTDSLTKDSPYALYMYLKWPKSLMKKD